MVKMLFTKESEKNRENAITTTKTFTENSKDSDSITQESIRETMKNFCNHNTLNLALLFSNLYIHHSIQ